MASDSESFDLAILGLSAGDGKRLELEAELGEFEFAGEPYRPQPQPCPVVVDVTRMNGDGWALKLAFATMMRGTCMRCLGPAERKITVEVREVDQVDGGEELDSPYIKGSTLSLDQWAHDSLALALPTQVICQPQCLGLCPTCGIDLKADPSHEHEADKDPRWSKLDELKFD